MVRGRIIVKLPGCKNITTSCEVVSQSVARSQPPVPVQLRRLSQQQARALVPPVTPGKSDAIWWTGFETTWLKIAPALNFEHVSDLVLTFLGCLFIPEKENKRALTLAIAGPSQNVNCAGFKHISTSREMVNLFVSLESCQSCWVAKALTAAKKSAGFSRGINPWAPEHECRCLRFLDFRCSLEFGTNQNLLFLTCFWPFWMPLKTWNRRRRKRMGAYSRDTDRECGKSEHVNLPGCLEIPTFNPERGITWSI